MAKSTGDSKGATDARVRDLEARVAQLERTIDGLECILLAAARALTSDEFPPPHERFWQGRPTEPNLHRIDTVLYTTAKGLAKAETLGNIRCPPWCKVAPTETIE